MLEEARMTIHFNADEVFQMAEQIERNGAKFYRIAAERTADPSAKQLLLDLAAMEVRHERIFAEMRSELTEEERKATFDPEGEAAAYLNAMADGHVFDLRDPSKRLTGKESLDDLFRIAIGIEKDSIVFYVTMTDLVPARFGRGKINSIINEEQKHIALLSRAMSLLKK
jgi:rubrerythrin